MWFFAYSLTMTKLDTKSMKIHNKPEWRTLPGLSDYAATLARMEASVDAIIAGEAREQVWLLEHEPLYTAGTSAKDEDIASPSPFPVHMTGRGGQYTYHGPGQRVVYIMLDLNKRQKDVRLLVSTLEQWMINVLAEFNIRGGGRQGRVGVWVVRPDKAPQLDGSPHEDKIAAIGIRLRKWVCFHGVSINVEPDLTHYDAITPCGINDPGLGVTSLVDLGLPVTMDDLDVVLRSEFEKLF